MADIEFESWIEGPRWLPVKQTVAKLIIHAGSNLTRHYVREDKGFIRTTVYFKVSGPKAKVANFRNILFSLVEGS